MKHNLGSADRAIRAFVIAPIALILAFLTGAGSVLGVILIVVAVILAATAAVGSCPLYRLFGLSTCPIERRQAHGSSPCPSPARSNAKVSTPRRSRPSCTT